MSDWPYSPSFPDGYGHITPLGFESIGAATGNLAIPASATWLNSTCAVFVPFRISRSIQLSQGFVFNGATATGAWCVGVYDSNGTLICSTGSTTQTTISVVSSAVIYTATVSSPTIGPGLFYLGMSANSSTATYWSAALNVQFCKVIGLATMQAAFPLPATATFATISSGIIPYCGVTVRSIV
jgi:hypothetical protein